MKNGLQSVIYLLYNSKKISVIGYINVQIIGIGYKKINIGRSLLKATILIQTSNKLQFCNLFKI